MERRLAAILFTDVVGYTELMGRDEVAGRRVRARHESLVRRQVARYHGRWIEEKGDESLSVFPSALEAVNCALAIQRELSEDAELQLRIGVHLGDVTVEDGRVYGDGVNVAARIRPLAAPGGVAVSGPVHDSIKNQTNLTATALGQQTLKNVAEPVAVWTLAGVPAEPGAAAPRAATARRPLQALGVVAGVTALAVVWLVATRDRPSSNAQTPIRSLAVLPLEDPRADPAEAYFSFSMTEALISELAKLDGLRVISRMSVTPFENTKLPIRQIAEQLGVEGIIEGSILRSGTRVRITAQLIDARTDAHIWAESYDRDLGDVLPLQAEVAREIARQVELEVLPERTQASATAQSMSPEAYEAYLKGYYFQMKRTREDTMRALAYFKEVIQLEPNHPLGYSGLADEYSCVPTHAWSISESDLWPSVPSEMIARARENSRRALELDPMSGPAHNSAALISTFGDWDWAAAETQFRRSLELSPSNAWAHYSYAHFLAFQRRFDEALAHLNEAVALDPLRVDYMMSLADLHAIMGDKAETYRLWKKSEEIDSTYPGLHQGVITGFCGTEHHGEALTALENANHKFPDDPLVLAEVAYCHAVAGNEARARELLATVEGMSDKMYVSHVSRAMVWVGLGEHQVALKALEQGIRERDFLSPYIGIEFVWDPLREDPGFQKLLDRLGLPRA